MIFTDTVTIYNHYLKNGEDCWKKTVLEGVQWKEKTEKVINSSGVLQLVQTVSLTVPFRAGYVPYKSFTGTGFTFKPIKALDVVVKGECPEEITDDYTITNLKKDYDSATIFSLSDNTNRDFLKHWKVGAK